MTTLTSATPAYGSNILPGPMLRPGGPPAGALTGADILRALRQRMVMILLLWFVMIGATVATTLYVQQKYPVYRADSLVRVESLSPPNPEDPLRRNESLTKADIERELQNQALLVRSQDVLTNALGDPEIKRLLWYTEAELRSKEKNEKLQDLLLDILSVGAVPDSNYLSVAASWRIKSEVPTIVNVIVQQYVSLVEKRQKEFINRQKDQMLTELERAQRALRTKKQEIEDFRNTTEFSNESIQAIQENVLTLTAMVTEFELELQGRRAEFETLQSVRPEDMPITGELQAELRRDPTLYQYEQRYLEARQAYELQSQRYGPNHRVVRDLRAATESAERAFSQDQARKIALFQSRQIEVARRAYNETQATLLALREKLIHAKAEQKDKLTKLAQYDALVDEEALLKLEYEKRLEQKNMLEMIIRQQQTVQISVASRAQPPERLHSPKLAVWIPAGTMLGLFVSVGFALLLELADKSVRTARDVSRAHLPVLGTIPSTDDDEVVIERVESACLDAPHSIVAEAFRNLRANLFFSAPAEQQGVILVTSPSGGNGKTTIACNLAISIALSGRRVLLIDANFRRSALPRVFENTRQEGLSNILIGQGDLKDFVAPTGVSGLDVLSAGPLPPNPAELLGSSYLRDVVVDARSRYDQVIFDGPPVLLVSDAMVLAGAVDGVLLVCEYRSTSRGALQRTQSNLEAINARIFGAVLNKVQSRAGGYFRRAYREFYEYHEADDEAAAARPRLDATATAATAAAAAVTADAFSPRGGAPGGSGGGGAMASAPAGELDMEDEMSLVGEDDIVDEISDALEAAAPISDEPPMAMTIEESEVETDETAFVFRDIGEPPAPPIEEPRAEQTAGEEWATLSDAPAPEEAVFDTDGIVEIPELEELSEPESVPFESVDIAPPSVEAPEVDMPEPEEPVHETPSAGPAASPPDAFVAPLEAIEPIDEAPFDFAAPVEDETAASEPGPTLEASPFELLEDELDLGDDLADLDSDEFRIDDKFDLDDDFDDPDSEKPR